MYTGIARALPKRKLLKMSAVDGFKRSFPRRGASLKSETVVDVDQATAPPVRKRLRLAIDLNDNDDDDNDDDNNDDDDNTGVIITSFTNGRPALKSQSRDSVRNGQTETLVDLSVQASTGSMTTTPPIDLSKSADADVQVMATPSISAPTIDLSNDESIAVEIGRSESYALRRADKTADTRAEEKKSGRTESSDRRKLEQAADLRVQQNLQSQRSADTVIDVDKDEALARELMLQEDERLAREMALQLAANDDAMIARAMAAEAGDSAPDGMRRPLHTARRAAYRAPAYLQQMPPVPSPSRSSGTDRAFAAPRRVPPHPPHASASTSAYVPAMPPRHGWRARRAYRHYESAYAFGSAGHVLGGAGWSAPTPPVAARGMSLNYVDRDFDANDCECTRAQAWRCCCRC